MNPWFGIAAALALLAAIVVAVSTSLTCFAYVASFIRDARADSALLKAVARARQWSEDLLAGRAQSVVEIAERDRVGSRYVRRLLRLAFLAPVIVEAIAAGDQPPELTAEALAERIDLPLLWTAQAKAVGIAS